ncbi:CCA tRNA nucleotidyltransferase [Helcobacillus massiliensis]|nr:MULTISPECIES: CCA tRNA nucleotidyltransferase [Helcobacillus]MCG7427814.1 CCA tRNA nucleotidyltransferase [Helcobacillus sp. ACRRO]MCT1558050.1 CCA tRNA nucleotidyltransferase [Helcobacillus massiliensis]MCT2037418.1 CCA tRNA nucleotidyltransferase [Helcobacillus massiliensis]MCT2330758.1 CCA tRNA nucleotidyltransferase [Helcobacillus massiliensis]MDK7741366.1 CCA tRNA nucleotidyltransferase [Helcobacillus massiliensis]
MFRALPQEIHDLGRLFEDAGHELALVGGPVRDAILGRSSSDLDFTTSARPDDTEAILKRWGGTIWDMGRDFGTLGAQKAGVQVEITTYRSETYDPLSRKPEVSYGDTIDGDLSRRDFTVNAMAVRLPSLEFIDPFGGLEDLAHGLLRTPVRAEQSFSDDPLRMMRAVRFASQLGFEIEDATAAAVTQLAERIDIVSAERVRDELVKLINGAEPRRGLEQMVDLGLAEYVLPELPALRLERDEHHHHKDVYEHTLTVLEQAIDLETDADGPCPRPDFVLRFAALMHDIGKPDTRRFEKGGQVTFRFHEIVGARMTAKRMKQLRFDKDTTKAVTRLVELHLRFHGYADGEWTDSAVRRYVTDAGPVLQHLHRLTRADCTTRNKRKARRLASAYDDLERRIDELAQQEEIDAIRPDLDGRQIMEILDLAPGPVVGEAYKHMLEVRMDEGPLSQEEATERLRAWWRARSVD